MDIQFLEDKLNNEILSYDEWKEIIEHLLNSEDLSDDMLMIHRDFFDNLIQNYDGKSSEINEGVQEILDQRSIGYFNHGILMISHFNYITNFNKEQWMLKIYFDSTEIHSSSIPPVIYHLLHNIDNIDEFCHFLLNYTKYTICRDSAQILIKNSQHELLFHLIQNNLFMNTIDKRDAESLLKKYQAISQNQIREYISKNMIKDKYGHKYNNKEIQILLGFGQFDRILCLLSSNDQLADDFLIDVTLFVLLLCHRKYNLILHFAKSNKIPMTNEFLDLFLGDIGLKSMGTINDKIFYTLINIYDVFLNVIPIQNTHLDLFFEKKWDRFIEYVVDKKHLKPNDKNLETFILNGYSIDLFDKYFGNMAFKEIHLQHACYEQDLTMIRTILNHKIKPTQECYNALFINYNDNIPDLIDILIDAGYDLENDDIIHATEHEIRLNESHFTDKFKPTELFYKHCRFDFKPEYNEQMYKDIYWVRRICELAKCSSDLIYVKSFVKKNKIKMDKVCLETIKGKNIKSKIKDELIVMCN